MVGDEANLSAAFAVVPSATSFDAPSAMSPVAST